MNPLFSDRINDVPRSFIREILKDALAPGTISFAGGLPNRSLFPARALEEATARVFVEQGTDIFQYSQSEGLLALREVIAARYRQRGLSVEAEHILITTGSQQGLDLLGKALVNEGDRVGIEEPGYLGAIQAFSIYRPRFCPIPVDENGMDVSGLEQVLAGGAPKLLYTVPNFQNPSGITYPDDNRRQVAEKLSGRGVVLVEDDPYGDLRFEGQPQTSFGQLLPEQTVMLGSFSKIIVPGFRIGWIVAKGELMHKLLIAKQASDLHTSSFLQQVMLQFLTDHDLDRHVEGICKAYGQQRAHMISAIDRHFPGAVRITRPQGGMFLWAELPAGLSAMRLFEKAVKERVVFVPGDPFYIGKREVPTLRLNYSCVNEELIEVGISRLGQAIGELLG